MIGACVKCVLVCFLLHATGSAQNLTTNANGNATTSAERLCLTQFLIEARATDAPAQIAAIKSKAERVRDVLRSGGSWSDVARTDSAGRSDLRVTVLGCLQRSVLARPIGEMKVGNVSDVLRKKSGFAVLQAWGEKPQSELRQPVVESGVRGKVVGTEGLPISEAYIVVHRDGAADAHVRTDSGGRYAMPLPIGVYDVFISADGFSPTSRKVQVGTDGMMVYDAVLEFNMLGMQSDKTP